MGAKSQLLDLWAFWAESGGYLGLCVAPWLSKEMVNRRDGGGQGDGARSVMSESHLEKASGCAWIAAKKGCFR